MIDQDIIKNLNDKVVAAELLLEKEKNNVKLLYSDIDYADDKNIALEGKITTLKLQRVVLALAIIILILVNY